MGKVKKFSPVFNLITDDELLDKARDFVNEIGKVSPKRLMQHLGINNYARAARMIDFLEHEGTVSPEDNHNWDEIGYDDDQIQKKKG